MRALKVTQRSWLDKIEVATPCSASWEDMQGDERVRFCGACSLNVYNLSAMTREDAAKLVIATEGRMCARFMRRLDGTVLTEDCPVGLAARLKRRTLSALAWFFAFVGLGAAGGLTIFKERPPTMRPSTGILITPPVQGGLRCPPRLPGGSSGQ